MLNLITAEEMRKADAYTCEHSKLSTIDLMEQAANAFTEIFVNHISPQRHVTVIAGTETTVVTDWQLHAYYG